MFSSFFLAAMFALHPSLASFSRRSSQAIVLQSRENWCDVSLNPWADLQGCHRRRRQWRQQRVTRRRRCRRLSPRAYPSQVFTLVATCGCPVSGLAAGRPMCRAGLIRRYRALQGLLYQELHVLSASTLQAAERGSFIRSCAFRTLGLRGCRAAQGCGGRRSACEAAARPAEENSRGKGRLASGRQEGAALRGSLSR